MRMRLLIPLALAAVAASCSYEESTREIGHKGRAKLNPYLAAERFLGEFEYEATSRPGWPRLDHDLATLFVPADVLESEGLVNSVDAWALEGGHAIVLLEHADGFGNDWSDFSSFRGSEAELPDALGRWVEQFGIAFGDVETDQDEASPEQVERLKFRGQEFEVSMNSGRRLKVGGRQRALVSREHGEGRVTLVLDGRPFRNRWIGDHEHAALLLALTDASPYEGSVAFVRSVAISFFGMLWERAWPALLGLLVLVGLWLWKNLPRFGPLDSRERTESLRAYDHHLEALGGFHWRLDRGQSLLRPLRADILERAKRVSDAAGGADLFDLMAERAGLTRERAERAMRAERPRDPASFTRVVADLQKIHLTIS